jgi:hypothetical protein
MRVMTQEHTFIQLNELGEHQGQLSSGTLLKIVVRIGDFQEKTVIFIYQL